MEKFFINVIPERDKKLSGIYKITNTINNKVYIGKTINFQKRYIAYKAGFKKKDVRKINQYFLNSIEKHGPQSFTFEIVEVCPVEILADRELYWMTAHNSTDQTFGYNLRMDSSTGMITHETTREKISKRVKQEYANGTRSAEAVGAFFSEMWKDDELKDQMRHQVSESRRSFFIQSAKDGTIIAVWNGINQIMNYNRDYKWQNVYAACNGNKKSYRGFLWKRVDDLEDWMVEYVVSDQTELAGRQADESIYETGQYHRGGLYTYEVFDGEDTVEMLGKDLKKLLPGIYHVFCRKKIDKVKHKGYIVTRRKLVEGVKQIP